MTTVDWRGSLEDWPASGVVDTEVPFDIHRTGLVLVDLQRGWTDPSGPTGVLLKERPDAFNYFFGRITEYVIPTMSAVLSRYRKLELPIIHVIFSATRADGSDLSPRELRRRVELKRRSDPHYAAAGTEWHEIAPELTPRMGEIVLSKTGWSAFNSTEIDLVLKRLGIEELLIGGLVTNACVDLTARDAADRGYETFIIEDGCATYTDAVHRAALQNFQRIHGRVLTKKEVLEG